jgi:hypothetical protein
LYRRDILGLTAAIVRLRVKELVQAIRSWKINTCSHETYISVWKKATKSKTKLTPRILWREYKLKIQISQWVGERRIFCRLCQVRGGKASTESPVGAKPRPCHIWLSPRLLTWDKFIWLSLPHLTYDDPLSLLQFLPNSFSVSSNDSFSFYINPSPFHSHHNT